MYRELLAVATRRSHYLVIMRLWILLAVAFTLWPLNGGGQQPTVRKLTLSKIEELVSYHVPDSTMQEDIQKRGLAFAPTPAIVESLRAKGAGPLTIAAIEGLLPNGPSDKTSPTPDLSGEFTSLLEKRWNWESHWRVFLGQTYFGSATSFGRGSDGEGRLRYSLSETEDYYFMRALAAKGLITLSKSSIANAPKSPRIDFGATVALTAAGAKFGQVDQKEHTVTFPFGTYGVQKIGSNAMLRIGETDYQLVEGTYALTIAPKFEDIWKLHHPFMQREYKFRALFKHDPAASKWEIAYASAGHGERAMDTGPREGNFTSEKVPQTVDQLRMTYSGATGATVKQYVPVIDEREPAIMQENQSRMNIKVARTDSEARFHYLVKFVVPNRVTFWPPSSGFDLITLYGYQVSGDHRVDSTIYHLPSIKGDWNVGDTVQVECDVLKEKSDPSQGWNLRFCVGGKSGCVPSSNLLAGAAK